MIRAIFLILANIIRLVVNKARYGTRYQSKLVERVSLQTSIALYDKGEIYLGYNVELAPHVDLQIHGHGRLTIGDRVYMNRGCMISCHHEVNIGNGCMFGPGVKIFDNNHKFARYTGVSCRLSVGNVSIGKNCWIASDVILLKGANIGDNCVIGAGCIISSTIKPNSIVRNTQNLLITPL